MNHGAPRPALKEFAKEGSLGSAVPIRGAAAVLIHEPLVQDVLHVVCSSIKKTAEVVAEDLGDLVVLRGDGACRMRTYQDVRQIPEWALRRQRLDGGNVEAGEADMATAQMADQPLFIDNLPPADIDEGNARLHGAKRRLLDHVLVRRRMRHA